MKKFTLLCFVAFLAAAQASAAPIMARKFGGTDSEGRRCGAELVRRPGSDDIYVVDYFGAKTLDHRDSASIAKGDTSNVIITTERPEGLGEVALPGFFPMSKTAVAGKAGLFSFRGGNAYTKGRWADWTSDTSIKIIGSDLDHPSAIRTRSERRSINPQVDFVCAGLKLEREKSYEEDFSISDLNKSNSRGGFRRWEKERVAAAQRGISGAAAEKEKTCMLTAQGAGRAAGVKYCEAHAGECSEDSISEKEREAYSLAFRPLYAHCALSHEYDRAKPPTVSAGPSIATEDAGSESAN